MIRVGTCDISRPYSSDNRENLSNKKTLSFALQHVLGYGFTKTKYRAYLITRTGDILS